MGKLHKGTMNTSTLVLATKKDATEDFEDVGHSQNARDMLKDYYVGDIDDNTLPQKGQYKPPSSSGSGSKQVSGSSSNTSVMLVLPILIMVLAYVFYYFAKTDKVDIHA